MRDQIITVDQQYVFACFAAGQRPRNRAKVAGAPVEAIARRGTAWPIGRFTPYGPID
jgi:hypothetical protein